LPASAQSAPFPTSSPFSLDPPKKITPAQLEWAKYLEAHPPAAEDNEPVLHNTAFFIEGGSGKVIGEYIKRNLWHPERDYLTAGEADHAVFDTKWGKMGMMICWDMSHPAAAQTLVDQGAEVVLAPTYWTATDSEP
jgi:predicted amidohydrolase